MYGLGVRSLNYLNVIFFSIVYNSDNPCVDFFALLYFFFTACRGNYPGV